MKLPHILVVLLGFVPAPASAGWFCSVPIEAGEARGYMARWIGHDGSPDDRIFIQLNSTPRPNETRLIGWRFADPLGYSLDPVAGPPEALPPPEQAFRAGPGVSVQYVWGRGAEGPIWAFCYADDEPAGMEVIRSRLQLRRSLRRGEWGSQSRPRNRAIVARLATARRWTIVTVDASGQELHREIMRLPTIEEIGTAYRVAKPVLDRITTDYRASCEEPDESNI